MFFVDTVGEHAGSDVARGFGRGDLLVTTTVLLDPNGDGKIVANGSDRFSFLGETSHAAGNVKLWAPNGKLVTAIAFDHTEIHNGSTYYVDKPLADLTISPDLVF